MDEQSPQGGCEGYGACADATSCTSLWFPSKNNASFLGRLNEPALFLFPAATLSSFGVPAKTQRSGFGGERRHSGKNEQLPQGGCEGYEACADADELHIALVPVEE
jgi:hypothetical protein